MFSKIFTQARFSEEDTFRRLRGYTFEEVRIELRDLIVKQNKWRHFFRYIFRTVFDKKNCSSSYFDETQKEREELLNQRGWTYEQYVSEIMERWM